jgi:hypothetical protein
MPPRTSSNAIKIKEEQQVWEVEELGFGRDKK